MNFIKRNADILLILVIGFLLRMIGVVIHSYSNDELSAVSRLRYHQFSDLIELGVQKGDMHPAGVQVFMKGWSLIFGKSEWAMRFPFVLLGVASILLLFLIGRTWFNRKVGLIAAGLLAVLYFPVLNTEFARPYSPGLFFSLFVGYHFYQMLVLEKTSFRQICWLGLGFAGAMYTHYFAFLFVLFIGFTGLFLLKRSTWKAYLIAATLGALLFSPHIPITLYHLNVGGLQWLSPPEPEWLLNFLFHAFNASWTVLGCVIFLILFGLGKMRKNEWQFSRSTALAALWFFGIYGLAHVYSFWGTPILKFPVMLFAFPYFLLLIAIPISYIPSNRYVLLGLLLVCGMSIFQEKHYHKNIHFALFKEPGLKMAEWRETYGEENIYTLYNLNNPDYINFYKNSWNGAAIDFDWATLEFDDTYRVYEALQKRPEAYCVIGFSSRLTLVQVFESALRFYPEVIDYEHYNNGTVFLLKRSTWKDIERKEEILAQFSSVSKIGKWDYDPALTHQTNKEGSHYNLSAAHKTGPAFHFKKADLPNYKAGYLHVSLKADLPEDAGLSITFSASRNGVPVQHRDKNVWIGHDVEHMIRGNDAKRGFFAFRLPPYLKETDDLTIQFWNRFGHEMELWDISITWVENVWNPPFIP